MKSFEYGDQEIGFKEVTFVVASVILGIGIITLPRTLAGVTYASDGWVCILFGGVIASFFVYIIAKLATRFPGQSFFQYTSRIVSKPVAVVLTFLFGVQALVNTAIEMRATANISKMYLFFRTPTEVLALVFLLVIVYAVSGSRVAILRLNLMFFPIVMFVAAGVVLMNIGFFQIDNLRPFITSDWKQLSVGIKEVGFSFLGFEVLLFYAMYINRPKEAAKASIIGVVLITLLYLFIFIFCIGVFGNDVTKTIIYPTVELAKEVEVPGEFFERFESIFFTIWLMTIFNTAAMAYDVAIMAFRSVFKKGKKMIYISVMSPIIFLIGMFPPTLVDFFRFGNYFSYSGLFLAMALPTILLLIAKLRGVRGDG